MEPSPACISLLTTFEGCKLTAYPDPATGNLPFTIGYGHTLGVRQGMVISQEQAEELLLNDLQAAVDVVNKWVRVALNQNQFDALTDFVYNIGPGMVGERGRDGFVWLKSGRHSTLLTLLNEGNLVGAAMEFPKWNLPPLPGIIRRRAAEQALFLRDDNLEPIT